MSKGRNTMKINNLKVGTTYKNWKELCATLEVEARTQGHKRHQEKEFKRYFNWEKQGQKITITEIFETPKDKEDGRKMNTFKEGTRHENPSFFTQEELPLALLWSLGLRAYRSGWKENTKHYAYIHANELFLSTGLCNEHYKFLNENSHKYAWSNKLGEQEQYCCKFQFDIAFGDLYEDMKRRTTTALSQLHKKKVLDSVQWRLWMDSNYESHLMTDEEMFEFQEARADVVDWWNETNPNNQISNVIDIYNGRLNHDDKTKCLNKLNYFLKVRINKDLIGYYNCFRVFYSLRTIKRELIARGYAKEELEDFESAYGKYMTNIIEGVNKKFLDRQINKIDDKRQKHKEVLQTWESEQVANSQKALGRQSSIQTKDRPFSALVDDNIYSMTVNLATLGIKIDLAKEEQTELFKIKRIVQKKNRG